MVNETVVFERDDIVVTQSLARFGKVSYPINGIGSVILKTPTLTDFWVPLILGVLMVMIAAAGHNAIFGLIGIASMARD